jgi:hypothetical protein
VTFEGRQATYGIYLTENLAADAQASWRLNHQLPTEDPEGIADSGQSDLRRLAYAQKGCLPGCCSGPAGSVEFVKSSNCLLGGSGLDYNPSGSGSSARNTVRM